MKTRNVELVLAPPAPHMVGDGFRVHNFIPSGYHLDMKRMSPFIMMDYNSKFYFPPTDQPRGAYIHTEVLKLLQLLITEKWHIMTVQVIAVLLAKAMYNG
jgi:hypothetical protein